MRLPFISRRQHDAEIAVVRAAAAYNAEQLEATSIVNTRLAEDLTALGAKLSASMGAESALARQIHEMSQPVEPTDSELDAITRLTNERNRETERAERLQAELDDARLLATRLTSVVESRQTLDDQARPIDAAAPARREGPSARLRRERDRVRKLEERLSDMQNSHVADTRELHDLRQKGSAS